MCRPGIIHVFTRSLSTTKLLLSCALLSIVPASSLTDNQTISDNTINSHSQHSSRSLIVGGTEAPIGRYSYSASLSSEGDFKTHLCGGTLIAPDIVLTAAHCAGIPGPPARVDIDQHNLDDRNEEHEYFFSKPPILHPNHVLLPDNFDHDFAIVKLYGAARTPPVKLNRDANEPGREGQPLTVFGWGYADDDVQQNMIKSPVLMEAEIGYIPNGVCRDLEGIDPKLNKPFSYGDKYIDEDTMCAFHPDKGSCLGDSGGPLIIRGNTAEEDLQVGLVSFGLDCNNDVLPGVYGRTSAVREWITEQVCELSSDPPADFGCPPREAPSGIKTYVTVEFRLGAWIPYHTGWMLESYDGKIIYAYRGTQNYGKEYLDQVVTETILVDNDQEYRFVIFHDDALGFCCDWYGEGYYRVFQGRRVSGSTVLLEGDGNFDTFVKEETFVLGNPPPRPPGPTPAPPPTPAPGTPFISVVIDFQRAAEEYAWGVQANDGSEEYADYRSTSTFRGLEGGSVTEEIYLFETSKGVEDYEFTAYNAMGNWAGTFEVYMGPVDSGRFLFSGDTSTFDDGRTIKRYDFFLTREDYDMFGTSPPPLEGETSGGGNDMTLVSTNGADKDTSSSSASRHLRFVLYAVGVVGLILLI